MMTLRTPNILIVDDQIDFTTILSNSLQEVCFVYVANTADAAINIVSTVPLDIVLLDIKIGDRSGFEIAKFINANAIHTPEIIFISGDKSWQTRLRSYSFMAVDYILKPFRLDELICKVNNKIITINRYQCEYDQSYQNSIFDVQQFPIINDSIYNNMRQCDRQFMQELFTVFLENISKQNFNLDAAANILGQSRRTLQRKTKALTGISFSVFLCKYRLQYSLTQLKNGISIKEVANNSGFNSASYFSTKFKTEFDISPLKQQKRLYGA